MKYQINSKKLKPWLLNIKKTKDFEIEKLNKELEKFKKTIEENNNLYMNQCLIKQHNL